jgi:hypothetical protein
MFQTNVTVKVKKDIFIFNNNLFENLVLYEIMWKNIVEPARPQMTVRRIRIAWWIPKATDTP